jgi:hypothetical protein
MPANDKESVKHRDVRGDRRPSLAFGLLAEKGKSKKLAVFVLNKRNRQFEFIPLRQPGMNVVDSPERSGKLLRVRRPPISLESSLDTEELDFSAMPTEILLKRCGNTK